MTNENYHCTPKEEELGISEKWLMVAEEKSEAEEARPLTEVR
jgi:hypothetical protein